MRVLTPEKLRIMGFYLFNTTDNENSQDCFSFWTLYYKLLIFSKLSCKVYLFACKYIHFDASPVEILNYARFLCVIVSNTLKVVVAR